ncbi:hypothetical protein COOONC_03176 [Cooperia oncophora]
MFAASSWLAERKLLDGESPHQLYIQNYSCASSSCLILRKWIFDPDRERQLCQKDPMFRQFVFHQAVTDINEVSSLCLAFLSEVFKTLRVICSAIGEG